MRIFTLTFALIVLGILLSLTVAAQNTDTGRTRVSWLSNHNSLNGHGLVVDTDFGNERNLFKYSGNFLGATWARDPSTLVDNLDGTFTFTDTFLGNAAVYQMLSADCPVAANYVFTMYIKAAVGTPTVRLEVGGALGSDVVTSGSWVRVVTTGTTPVYGALRIRTAGGSVVIKDAQIEFVPGGLFPTPYQATGDKQLVPNQRMLGVYGLQSGHTVGVDITDWATIPGAALFDGANDFGTYGDVLRFGYTNSYSLIVTGWALDWNQNATLVAKFVEAGVYPGYGMFVNARKPFTAMIGELNVNQASRIGPNNLTNDQWACFAVSRTKNTSLAGLNMYVDSALVTGGVTVDTLTSFDGLTATGLQIGARDGTNTPFAGKVGQALVYSRDISLSEVVSTCKYLKAVNVGRGIALP